VLDLLGEPRAGGPQGAQAAAVDAVKAHLACDARFSVSTTYRYIVQSPDVRGGLARLERTISPSTM
jgi:hypothetical protein